MRLVQSIITIGFVAAMTSGCDIGKGQFDPITTDVTAIDQQNPPAIRELAIDSHGKRMNAILYQANGAGPHPTVILLHGLPGNEKNLDVAQNLRRAGFNVLFFHYRGAWGSDGTFSLDHVVEDVQSATDFLRANADNLRVDSTQLIMVGHSLGGYAALQGAANDPAIRCVAGLAPADFGIIGGLFRADAAAAKGFRASVDNMSMLNTSGDAFGEPILSATDGRYSLVAQKDKFAGKSVLLIAGSRDRILPPQVFHEALTEAIGSVVEDELSTHMLEDDHSFSATRIALSRLVSDWATDCAQTKRD